MLRLSVHVVQRLQQRDARGRWWQLMTAERRHVIWWAGERRPGRKPVTATRRQDTSGVYFCPLQWCCRVRMCVTSPKITLMSRKSLLWKPEVGLEVQVFIHVSVTRRMNPCLLCNDQIINQLLTITSIAKYVYNGMIRSSQNSDPSFLNVNICDFYPLLWE